MSGRPHLGSLGLLPVDTIVVFQAAVVPKQSSIGDFGRDFAGEHIIKGLIKASVGDVVVCAVLLQRSLR